MNVKENSFLTLEDRTDRLSRKRLYGITTIRCVTPQKSADLTCQGRLSLLFQFPNVTTLEISDVTHDI